MICPYCYFSAPVNDMQLRRLFCPRCAHRWAAPQDDILTAIYAAERQLQRGLFVGVAIVGVTLSKDGWRRFFAAAAEVYALREFKPPRPGETAMFYGRPLALVKEQREPFLFSVLPK